METGGQWDWSFSPAGPLCVHDGQVLKVDKGWGANIQPPMAARNDELDSRRQSHKWSCVGRQTTSCLSALSSQISLLTKLSFKLSWEGINNWLIWGNHNSAKHGVRTLTISSQSVYNSIPPAWRAQPCLLWERSSHKRVCVSKCHARKQTQLFSPVSGG